MVLSVLNRVLKRYQYRWASECPHGHFLSVFHVFLSVFHVFFITFGVPLLPVFTGHCYRVVKTRQNPSKPVKVLLGTAQSGVLVTLSVYIHAVSSFLVVLGVFHQQSVVRLSGTLSVH